MRSGAGIVVDPQDTLQFVDAIRHFFDHEKMRSEAGARGRNYADATFDITLIADRFEGIFQSVRARYGEG